MNDFANDMWDTHIHCLDPVRYPFKPTRSYTPAPAPLEQLVKNVTAKKVVLVQASVEDGCHALLNHLGRLRSEYPDLLARGIISLDDDLGTITEVDFNALHDHGVRFCRIHGYFGGSSTGIVDLHNRIKLFARSYPAQSLGWGISAQLPFLTWLSLKPFLCEDLEVRPIPIIIDHVGCLSPADIENTGFNDFITLLQRDGVHIKISALYRRSESVLKMQPIIQRLAETAPSAMLWGSDWPHVDSSYRGDDAPPISDTVNAAKELLEITSWISKEQAMAMLVDNPGRVFGP